jgi:probable dihydroxyacetone kinase regulator
MPNQHSGERTKLMIANSLRKLMQKKPLDKIKIREIVDDCGVNRQTFYYHFQDIYALVEWIYERDATIMIEANKNTDDWMQIVKEIFRYIEEHRSEIMCVLNSKAYMYFSNFVYKDLNACMKSVIDVIAVGLDVDDYYKSFISSFYTLALSGVVDNWIRNNNSTRMSSSEFVHMIDVTITGNIRSALERCSEENSKF